MTRWVCVGIIALLAAPVVVGQRADQITDVGGLVQSAPRLNAFGGGGVVSRQFIWQPILRGNPAKVQFQPGLPPGGIVGPGVDGQGNPRRVRPGGVPGGMAKLDRYGDAMPVGAITRYGTVRLRHGPEPTGLAFSHDGKTLGSLSNTDDGIRIWDPISGKELARLNSNVTFGAFARDGSVLIVDGDRCKHWIPSTNGLRELPEKTLPEGTTCVAVSPDVRVFAAGSLKKLTLIDLQSGKHIRELNVPGEQPITRLVYSSDGRWLAGVGGGQKTGVWLWDLRLNKRVRTYRSEFDFPEFSFSLDNTRIVIAAEQLRVYSLDSEEPLEDFKSPEGQFQCPRFSTDGKWVFGIMQDGKVTQIDAATGEVKEPLEGIENIRAPFALAPDALLVAALDTTNGIRIWDPKTGKGPEAERLPMLTDPGFSADGKTVWVLALDGKIHSFDAATGKPTKVIELPVDENTAVTWDPVARRATSPVNGEELELQVIDVDTGKVVAKLPVPPNVGIPVVAFCPTDRNRVALFGLGVVNMVNASNGKPIRTLNYGKPEESPPSRGAISPDGRLVAINTRPLSVWEVSTGKKRFDFDSMVTPEAAVFSPDGRSLAGWDGNGIVIVFDVRLGTITRRFESPAGGDLSTAFSPDGKRLAVGEREGSVSVWDITTGDAIVTFERHDGMVTGVAWSPDGNRVASAASDGTVLVWDVPAKPIGRPAEAAVLGFDDAFKLLGSPDPVNAQRGMEFLYRRTAETPKQCAERVPLPAAAVAGRIAKLLADLEDEDFPVRQAAVKELEAIGGETTPHLRTVIEKSQSAEARKLATEVLTRIESAPASADLLRGLRCVEVLESIATPDARAALAKWAAGPSGHRLTAEAASAVARLKARGN